LTTVVNTTALIESSEPSAQCCKNIVERYRLICIL
jgi:hypothetical protein